MKGTSSKSDHVQEKERRSGSGSLDLVDIFILKLDVVISAALVLLVQASDTLVETDVLRKLTVRLEETCLIGHVLEDDVGFVVLVVTEADEDDVPSGDPYLLVHLTTDVAKPLSSIDARRLAAAVAEHPEHLGVLLTILLEYQLALLVVGKEESGVAMATTEQSSFTHGKTGPETGNGGGAFAERRPPTNLFRVDFLLRLLLLASSVSALVVLVTSKQSREIRTGLPPPFAVVSREAKFQDVPAFIYLLAALCVSTLYSFVTMFASFFSISSPSPSTRILFLLALCDALMAGVMASAMGSAGSIAYLGLRGNSHANWAKICNTYGKFCRHVGSSVGVSLVATIVLVQLVVLSSYSLYRRTL